MQELIGINSVSFTCLETLMIEKELKLGTLWAIQVVSNRDRLDIVQPILKLKHQKRFQTQIINVFEQFLPEQ